MTSFAITFYGQCCRRHFVGQQVIGDVSVIRRCWSILCSESNNTSLRLLIAILGTSILFHIGYQTHFAPQHCTLAVLKRFLALCHA